MDLRFYLDENVPIEVARQLQLSGIEAISAHSLDKLGDPDESHLRRAHAMSHILCTHDADFLRLAAEGEEHAGIAFLAQQRASIGLWVRALRALHAGVPAEEARGRVFFL